MYKRQVFVISIIFGFRPHNWALIPVAFATLVFMSVALTCFGAGIASMVEDFQGFQGINNLLILPLFFLSGALYPLSNIPIGLKIISICNPVTYMVDALRGLLSNQSHFGLKIDLLVMTLTFIVTLFFAVNRFNEIEV